MTTLLPKFWRLLTPAEKCGLFPLLLLMIVGAFLELIGLGLIMPVIAILANPLLIEQNKYLNAIHTFINPASNKTFLLTLCFGVAAIYLVKNVFLAFATRLQVRFVSKLSERMASGLFDSYVRAPYSFHLAKNSSDLLNNINMVSHVASSLFVPGLMFVTEMVTVLAILGVMLFFVPLATLGLAIVSLTIILGLYYPFKRYNLELGERINRHSAEIFRDIMQAFEGIKECKVRNCEGVLSDRHARHQKLFREAEMSRGFISQLPRFSIEALIVVAGMGTLAIFVMADIAMGSIILKLSLVAVALIRLMPSFSRIQYQLNSMRQSLHSSSTIYDDLEMLRPPPPPRIAQPPITFSETIRLDNLSFSYAGTDDPILAAFSTEIRKNASVAFVGPTGCGKTTLMDIILGLLKPTSGRVLVDGRDISENLPSWQTKIGYVPQFIFLMDASIRENVAFGELPEHIDDAHVRHCLAMAQLLDFVDGLPLKLETAVGERGVRFSGGQRQRIGIARALYHNPEILAFDEATSALDTDTEKAFVDALRTLKGRLTIIMIAHRLSTVQDCDTILKLHHPRATGG